ncbi:hypothetical protein CO174_01725 [Candidatus Uhrbacteria bacterium CG_4_9_14_3_um_filter_50_9]|uniref:Uncharacterized protein n=1 Tax=Candidatus Uhrbacteria bacterium CG_4_9_14_3_um_filter_50_9 TaxID=1975035 RepID=A0A2M7XCV7_9BACT|nr:MAG: hypothetical protein CO174_01725 [Candidatus Uhrbacteria bacterium CG_4_9_14_3_um_filter_50_9]
MSQWLNEERRQRYDLVRLGNEQVHHQIRGVKALERIAQKRDLSGQNFHPGPTEVTIDFAPLVRAQQEVASSIYAVAQAESANGVILTRIEDGIEASCTIQQGMLDELLVIEDVMRDGFTYLGVRLSRIDGKLSDITGELREANALHQAHLDETRLQGELGRAQMAQLISMQNQEAWKRTRFQEEGAEHRHQEQMGEGRVRFARAANEKYTHAVTQYDTGNIEACLIDLDDVFTQQSTHVPGHILFGVCAFRLGQPAVAKDAFRHAAAYALKDGFTSPYTDAMLRLARLERLVENHDQGLAVIREALEAMTRKAEEEMEMDVNGNPNASTIDLINQLEYEEVLARFVHPDRTESLDEIVRDLRGVLRQQPELRDEVAGSLLWKEAVDADPYLRYGNAPFITLAEYWIEVDAKDKPCADPDLYDMALHLCEVGKVQLPTAVRDHLSWAQQWPTVFIAMLDLNKYEQMQIWIFQTLASKGKDLEAQRVLYADLNPQINGWLPEVVFERFKFEIKDRPVDEEMVRRIKTDLRRILSERPQLRDEVAHDRLFEECRERCPWLSSGNSPYVQLVEAVGMLPLVEALDAPQDVKGDLGILVSEIRRIMHESDWGRRVIASNDQLFMKEVEPFFRRLAGPASAPLPTLEALSTLVRDQAIEVHFYGLMIQPCTDASQLPAFEKCFQQMYVVAKSARHTVATSPLFEGYRRERAMEDARLRREAEMVQQQLKDRLHSADLAWSTAREQLRDVRTRLTKDEDQSTFLRSASIPACLWKVFRERINKLVLYPDRRLIETQPLFPENLISWYEHRTSEINHLLAEVATEEERMQAQQRAERKWYEQQERQKKEQRTLFRQALLWLSGAIICSCFVAISVGLWMTGELPLPDLAVRALPLVVGVVILLKGFCIKISEWVITTRRANRRTPIKEE